VPCPGGRGRRAPRSAVSRSREAGARCSEERRGLPQWAGCPSRNEVRSCRGGVRGLRGGPVPCPGGMGGRCSEELRFPVPVEPGARCPEGRRLLGSDEAVRSVLRRAPVAVPRGPGLANLAVGSGRSRWGADPPKRSGSLSRWGGGPILRRGPVPCPGGVGGPMLRGAPSSLSRWGGGPDAPRSAEFPVPVRSCARCSEERRLPCPGEVVRAVLRRAPVAVPRWNQARGAPRGAVCRIPVAGCPAALGGDGCARKRFRCDDAPIRRSGPPRHRAHSAGGCRSAHPCHVKSPRRCRCRSANAAMAIKPPPGAGSAPDDRDRSLPAARRRPPGFHDRGRGVSVALRLHPPRWADVWARRNLTEQPTSRLCSADESVVTDCRCQPPVTRSFHGLCGPLQGPA